jgi:hypothetical protein
MVKKCRFKPVQSGCGSDKVSSRVRSPSGLTGLRTYLVERDIPSEEMWLLLWRSLTPAGKDVSLERLCAKLYRVIYGVQLTFQVMVVYRVNSRLLQDSNTSSSRV